MNQTISVPTPPPLVTDGKILVGMHVLIVVVVLAGLLHIGSAKRPD